MQTQIIFFSSNIEACEENNGLKSIRNFIHVHFVVLCCYCVYQLHKARLHPNTLRFSTPSCSWAFYSQCWKCDHTIFTTLVTNMSCRCVQMSSVCPVSGGVCFPAALHWPSHFRLWASFWGQASLCPSGPQVSQRCCPTCWCFSASCRSLTGSFQCQDVIHNSITEKVINSFFTNCHNSLMNLKRYFNSHEFLKWNLMSMKSVLTDLTWVNTASITFLSAAVIRRDLILKV